MGTKRVGVQVRLDRLLWEQVKLSVGPGGLVILYVGLWGQIHIFCRSRGSNTLCRIRESIIQREQAEFVQLNSVIDGVTPFFI